MAEQMFLLGDHKFYIRHKLVFRKEKKNWTCSACSSSLVQFDFILQLFNSVHTELL